MKARIFQPSKTAMQSGKAKTRGWAIALIPDRFPSKGVDPVMGWTTSDNTLEQVHLYFHTLEECKAYADKKGLEYDIEKAPHNTRSIQPKNYQTSIRLRSIF